MSLPTLAELAKMTARFARYEDGNLYYEIDIGGYGPTFQFPISVFDSGKGGLASDSAGTFLPEEKGINLMRWIRKERERLETEQRTNERLKSEWAQKLAENGGAEG